MFYELQWGKVGDKKAKGKGEKEMGGWGNEELLFHGNRVSVLQNEELCR